MERSLLFYSSEAIGRNNENEVYWRSTPKFDRVSHVAKLRPTDSVNVSSDNISLSSSEAYFLSPYLYLLSYLWFESKLRLLGVGTFGKVFSVNYRSTRFAVKFCVKRISADRGEFNSLSLTHSNIARSLLLLDVSTTDLETHNCHWIYKLLLNQLLRSQTSYMQILLMEFVGEQSLQQIISDNSQQINEVVRNSFCMQVSNALSYCHRNWVIHLDLKPSNIVVTADGICKLVDFGCSRNVKEMNDSDRNRNHKSLDEYAFGTVAYTAPEIFRDKNPSEKCDIYSFGIIMWQLITRENPYSNLGVDCPQTIIYKVVADNLRPKFPDDAMTNYSEYCKLAECCWHVSPIQRPPAAMLWQKFNTSLQ